MVTRAQALAAIQAELGPERPLSALPPDVQHAMADGVVGGWCSAAQAAEAIAVAVALARAHEHGNLSDASGVDAMRRLAHRHNRGVPES